MMNDTTPASLTQADYYAMAVLQASRDALAAFPGERQRITDAVRMIGEGLVTLTPRGALVDSDTTFGLRYRVGTTCECLAYLKGMERCKHRYAVWITKRALAILQAEAEAVSARLERDPFTGEWRERKHPGMPDVTGFYTVAYIDGHEVEGRAAFARTEGDDPEDAIYLFTPAGEQQAIELPYWSLFVPGRKPRKRGRVPVTA